jgi:hypothetical protein
MKPGAGCPIFARPFAQEPAVSGVEGVGFHSRRPLGILSSDMTEKSGSIPSRRGFSVVALPPWANDG